MTDPALQQDFAEDVVLLKLVGMNPVVVHGGGPQIETRWSAWARGHVHPGHARHRRRDDGSRRVGAGRPGAAGHRRPDQRGRRQGGGPDRARRRPDPRAQDAAGRPRRPDMQHDVGQVGEIESIDPSVVKALQDDQFIPVISPIGFGASNESYNINADLVAGKLATVLQAEKLLLLTNTPGVLDKNGKLLTELTRARDRRPVRRRHHQRRHAAEDRRSRWMPPRAASTRAHHRRPRAACVAARGADRSGLRHDDSVALTRRVSAPRCSTPPPPIP